MLQVPAEDPSESASTGLGPSAHNAAPRALESREVRESAVAQVAPASADEVSRIEAAAVFPPTTM